MPEPKSKPNPQTPSKTGTRSRRSGPAILVAAAFVGPGTVMTASKAGAQFGFSLLWAVLFSIVAAVVLQEMAARLGIVAKTGLAESIRNGIQNRGLRIMAILLVLSAILIGNCAFQTGNIVGAASGLEIITPFSAKTWSLLIALVAAAIVILGRSDLLRNFLTGLVALMGVLFVLAATFCRPAISDLIAGFRPGIPDGSEWLLIALIGTTVVSYNLFLHASSAAEFWNAEPDTAKSIRRSVWDTLISISIGGIITAAILITAAVTFAESDQQLTSVKDVANQLKPTLGPWAEVAFALGLFAAGLTSSITAPIAAAFATSGCFGWDASLKNPKLKAVSLMVIVVGLICVWAFEKNASPKEIIIFAQVANGLLLPIVVVFLIWTVNQTKLMGEFRNRMFGNLLAVLILAVTLLIAARNFHGAWKGILDLFSS